jgi:hypothetical protein
VRHTCLAAIRLQHLLLLLALPSQLQQRLLLLRLLARLRLQQQPSLLRCPVLLLAVGPLARVPRGRRVICWKE